MKIIDFQIEDQKAARFVKDSLVVDHDEEGAIISIEIIGYSYISGKMPAETDLTWLEQKVLSLRYDEESDVLSIQVAYGNNAGQKTLEATFGFDSDGQLLSLTIEDHA